MPDRGELIAAHIPGLRRFARALLRGDPEGADDLVQLYTILYNRFRSECTSRIRRGVHQELDTVPDPELPGIEGGQEAAVMYRDLLRGFAQLSEDQRAVVFLIGVEDLSYEEAARVLGVPIGTVMSRLSRGREALRRYMNGDRQLPHTETRRAK